MTKTKEKIEVLQAFPRLLMQWNRTANSRQMPWKGEKDPYKIWLSEIILQQTRVDQGLTYYEKFIASYPTIHQLANAPDDAVFKLWEGLGYYTRCRNLLATARHISQDLNGKFPTTYQDILRLKGVGPYTAAAISSFAFNLPYAVVDGNVFRVLSRIFNIDLAIDSTAGKKFFTQLANDALDKKQPGLYNQAIMDFGATVCKPVAPLCTTCPLNTICAAFLNSRVNELPVKEKKPAVRKRFFYYIIMKHGDTTAIRQRTGKDIWNQLHEFPLVETDQPHSTDLVLDRAEEHGLLKKGDYRVVTVSPEFKQQLTHQLITGRFVHVEIKRQIGEGWQWANREEMRSLAFPKFINQYLGQL